MLSGPTSRTGLIVHCGLQGTNGETGPQGIVEKN